MKIIAATMSVVLTFAATVTLAQSGDASRGERLFNQQCKVCHTLEKGGRNGIGPNLFGIFGPYPDSVILNREHPFAVRVCAIDVNARWFIGLTILNRVGNQILEDLENLALVGGDRG